jgi:hypothetical protein
MPYYPGEGRETPGRWLFSWLWFEQSGNPNTVHLIGGDEVADADDVFGLSKRFHGEAPNRIGVRASYSFVGNTQYWWTHGSVCFAFRPLEVVVQDISAHELVHQNPTNPLQPQTGQHCWSNTWISPGEACLLHETGHCPGVEPVRLDADVDSFTSANGGDLYDVRYNEDPLPNE